MKEVSPGVYTFEFPENAGEIRRGESAGTVEVLVKVEHRGEFTTAWDLSDHQRRHEIVLKPAATVNVEIPAMWGVVSKG